MDKTIDTLGQDTHLIYFVYLAKTMYTLSSALCRKNLTVIYYNNLQVRKNMSRVQLITATSTFLKHYYQMSLAQQGWRHLH